MEKVKMCEADYQRLLDFISKVLKRGIEIDDRLPTAYGQDLAYTLSVDGRDLEPNDRVTIVSKETLHKKRIIKEIIITGWVPLKIWSENGK